jgi:hypothetical protein
MTNNKEKAEATKNTNGETNTTLYSKNGVINVVQDLQKIVKKLKMQKNSTALVTEYENAIAVLTGRVKLTSGNFNAVISDLCERIKLEQAYDNPDTKKIQSYLDTISKLENACV